VIMVGEALRAEEFVESHLYGKRTRLRRSQEV
jgi:precorrin-4 methylase